MGIHELIRRITRPLTKSKSSTESGKNRESFTRSNIISNTMSAKNAVIIGEEEKAQQQKTDNVNANDHRVLRKTSKVKARSVFVAPASASTSTSRGSVNSTNGTAENTSSSSVTSSSSKAPQSQTVLTRRQSGSDYSYSSDSSSPLGISPQIVAQSNALGQPISPTVTAVTRRAVGRPSFAGGRVPPDSFVEDIHPSLVSPRCKPNDVILMYRDMSELISTAFKSVLVGFSIMFNDAASLRRRALHEQSATSLNGSSSCKIETSLSTMRIQERSERSNLVIWWKPIYTLWYFLLECKCLLFTYTAKLWHNRGKFILFLVFLAIMGLIYNTDGQHQQYVSRIEKKVLLCSYWIALGIMSSVGLGTGLHTFVLYLGPFIAAVTLAAYECKSLDFPEPPYPTSIVCPNGGTSTQKAAITLWSIMGKVRLEAMMWGVGTAIGELPPYFMARAAKLSGTEEDIEDEDIEEILNIEEKERDSPDDIKQMGFVERSKVYMHDLVHRLGFFGILACASIPNPLFDLAGITCGHFLVPFWTFFGATLIGKAVIKMHIQKLIVIFAFSQHHVEYLINLLKSIPKIGERLGEPFKEYLMNQRAKLHKADNRVQGETPWLAWVFEKIIILMVIYFIISIVNSFAQSYHKRVCIAKRKAAVGGGKLK